MVNDGNSDRSANSNGNEKSSSQNDGNKRRFGRRPFIKATGAGAAATGLAGCLGILDSGDEGGRKIGVMGPTSGTSQEIGKNQVNAAKLAASEINENGGINGEEVEIIGKDSSSSLQSKYEDLYLSEGVDATAGIFSSENLNTIADRLSTSETIHLTAGAATHEPAMKVDSNYEDYKYFFRVGPTNATFLAQSMLQFADGMLADMGWQNVGILVEDRDWTRLVQGPVAARLKQNSNVNVVYNERIPADQQDWSTVFNNIENAGADGVLTAFAHSGATPTQQWGTIRPDFGFGGINVPAQMFSTYNALSEAVDDEPSASEYVFTQTAATAQAEVTSKTKDFASAYSDEYDTPPIYTGYHTYDAIYSYKAAVEEAGTFETDEVIAALENLDYTGVAGNINFYGSDDTFELAGEEVTFRHDIRSGEEGIEALYFQWQDGNQEVIFPEDLQSSQYETAPWI